MSWRLAPGLDLHLGHELALGLLGGQAGDGLELAPLLVERRSPAAASFSPRRCSRAR